MEPRYEYWQYARSGEIYAVKLLADEIIGTCGPLHHSEVTSENLPDFAYTDDDLVWFLINWDNFELHEPQR